MYKKNIILALMALPTLLNAQQIKYPSTPKDGTVDTYFGTQVADPYRWLENDTSEATAAWVKAENAVTDAYLKRIPFRSKLLKRLKEVSNYGKEGIPFHRNGKWYFYKNDGLQNQSVLYECDQPGGEARVMLDPNLLSTDGTVALTGIYFSHNGKYMAYSISRSGSDWQEFYVMDVATRQLLSDHIQWAKFSGAAWCGDGFYYSAYDSSADGREYSNKNEGHKIYYHKIGTPQSADELFYQNPAYPQRFYTTWVNREETVMLLTESGAGAGNNLFVRDLRKKGAQFIQMTSDMDYLYDVVEIKDNTLYIQTNYGAPKGRLMTCRIDKPGIYDWQELVGESTDVLESTVMAGGHLVLSYSKDATTHAYIYDLQGRREQVSAARKSAPSVSMPLPRTPPPAPSTAATLKAARAPSTPPRRPTSPPPTTRHARSSSPARTAPVCPCSSRP